MGRWVITVMLSNGCKLQCVQDMTEQKRTEENRREQSLPYRHSQQPVTRIFTEVEEDSCIDKCHENGNIMTLNTESMERA